MFYDVFFNLCRDRDIAPTREVDYFPTGKDGVRIRSNKGHHKLTVRTFVITVSTESLSIKGKLPSR